MLRLTAVADNGKKARTRVTCCGGVLRESEDGTGFVCEKCGTFYAAGEVQALFHKAIAALQKLVSEVV